MTLAYLEGGWGIGYGRQAGGRAILKELAGLLRFGPFPAQTDPEWGQKAFFARLNRISRILEGSRGVPFWVFVRSMSGLPDMLLGSTSDPLARY